MAAVVQPVGERVAAATLACLPGITPPRLRALVTRFGGAIGALDSVRRGDGGSALGPRSGDADEIAALWARAADPDRVAAVIERRATTVLTERDPAYPIRDPLPDRPAVLFVEGDRLDALRRPMVAVVGTRAATPHGLADARDLGRFLAETGITVVSGLAIGIDAAVHEGALAAGGTTVGVVATGLDVVYPRRHRVLFERVRRQGVIVSESGFGVQPIAHRFPVRNRIIAALGDVCVVVEATATGGARITAEHALHYGRQVLAMPGSRRNPAAAGCNALLADGAHPLLEPGDVVVALRLAGAAVGVEGAAGEGGDGARGSWTPRATAPLDTDAAALLRALGGEPATLDQLAGRTGLPPDRVAAAARSLERARRAERRRGLLWPC